MQDIPLRIKIHVSSSRNSQFIQEDPVCRDSGFSEKKKKKTYLYSKEIRNLKEVTIYSRDTQAEDMAGKMK